jgi:hypothetical protein
MLNLLERKPSKLQIRAFRLKKSDKFPFPQIRNFSLLFTGLQFSTWKTSYLLAVTHYHLFENQEMQLKEKGKG